MLRHLLTNEKEQLGDKEGLVAAWCHAGVSARLMPCQNVLKGTRKATSKPGVFQSRKIQAWPVAKVTGMLAERVVSLHRLLGSTSVFRRQKGQQ